MIGLTLLEISKALNVFVRSTAFRSTTGISKECVSPSKRSLIESVLIYATVVSVISRFFLFLLAAIECWTPWALQNLEKSLLLFLVNCGKPEFVKNDKAVFDTALRHFRVHHLLDMSRSSRSFLFFLLSFFKPALLWVSDRGVREKQMPNCGSMFQRLKWWDGQNYWQICVLVLETTEMESICFENFHDGKQKFLSSVVWRWKLKWMSIKSLT